MRGMRRSARSPVWLLGFLGLLCESRSGAAAGAEPNARAADGCWHVFLDVGANVGMHTRFLFQPELYPLAKYSVKIFDEWLGPAADRAVSTTCSFAFEPNPMHRSRHEALARDYGTRGWRYEYYGAGAGAAASELMFFPNDRSAGGARHNSWGFGTKCRDERCDKNVTVPIMDLDAFINTHVVGRRLPEPPSPAALPPRVLMKMDIETSEFGVLERLSKADTLCRAIDFMTIEWHGSMAPFVVLHADGSTTMLQTKADAAVVRLSLETAINARSLEPTCATQFSHINFDDESYSNFTLRN